MCTLDQITLTHLLCLTPIVAGVLCLLIPRKFQSLAKWFAEIVLLVVAVGAVGVFFGQNGQAGTLCPLFYSDNLARLMCMISSVMAFVIFALVAYYFEKTK